MKELQDAQEADVTHKLSERNVVEIVEKITKKGLIDLLKQNVCFCVDGSTRSGIREYLTWSELETEILEEIDAHDGRVTYQELEVCVNNSFHVQDAINVDITYIEKSVKELCSRNCGVMNLRNQEIISDRYFTSAFI